LPDDEFEWEDERYKLELRLLLLVVVWDGASIALKLVLNICLMKKKKFSPDNQ
jgi:hypothetical protein